MLLAFFKVLLFMIVPHDLLCTLCHSEGAFHYNTPFVITLISLVSQNEHYNEVAVYFSFEISGPIFAKFGREDGLKVPSCQI